MGPLPGGVWCSGGPLPPIIPVLSVAPQGWGPEARAPTQPPLLYFLLLLFPSTKGNVPERGYMV